MRSILIVLIVLSVIGLLSQIGRHKPPSTPYKPGILPDPLETRKLLDRAKCAEKQEYEAYLDTQVDAAFNEYARRQGVKRRKKESSS